MFCTKCGKKLSADELFCTACGTKVTGESMQPKEKMVADKTKVAIAPEVVEEQQEAEEVKGDDTQLFKSEETSIVDELDRTRGKEGDTSIQEGPIEPVAVDEVSLHEGIHNNEEACAQLESNQAGGGVLTEAESPQAGGTVPTTTKSPKREGQAKKKNILFVLIGLLIVLGGIGGVYLYQQSKTLTLTIGNYDLTDFPQISFEVHIEGEVREVLTGEVFKIYEEETFVQVYSCENLSPNVYRIGYTTAYANQSEQAVDLKLTATYKNRDYEVVSSFTTPKLPEWHFVMGEVDSSNYPEIVAYFELKDKANSQLEHMMPEIDFSSFNVQEGLDLPMNQQT